MADPANTPAADSTSRQKRELHVQPRNESKRFRSSLPEATTAETKSHKTSKRNKNKQSNASQSSKNSKAVEIPSTSRLQDTTSESSVVDKKESCTQNLKLRRVSKSDHTLTSPDFELDFEGIPHRRKKHSRTNSNLLNNSSVDPNKNNTSNFENSSNTSTNLSNLSHSVSSNKPNSLKSSAKQNLRNSESFRLEPKHNSKPSTSSSNIDFVENLKKKHLSNKHKHGIELRKNSSLLNLSESASTSQSLNSASETSVNEAGTSNLNVTYPLPSHKYLLRSQSKASLDQSNIAVQLFRKATEKRRSRDLKALGASTSHQVAREESESSRLTRSGAVLRRTTRNKGHSSTTGSCASSSGASGSGSSSRRAARQHKVGAAAPAPPATTTSNSAAAMASDQPDMPNNGLGASEDLSVAPEGAQAIPTTTSGLSAPGVDSESDDSEVGRLQALLEARGLPPHLFGALGPRMQHLLHRSMGSTTSATKAQNLLPGLQATGDEGQQLQAVIEMCQLLVMGNEDTLSGFPMKQVVPALINLLQVEHNFDIMNHACRALTYMMEALPRSSAVVVEAVPVFLEKLQFIQCMDVAEQSLTALDMLSRRHSKAILQAKGVQACLMYLDFFSINAQRNALSITANCCSNLTMEEFQFVSESLSLLASRLTQQDKKSVESVCLAFFRLVESFQSEPSRLQEIAGSNLLTNLQQLLVVTPPVISTATFISVLRMLSIMCASCPDLAFTLLRQNIAETLLYLLTGSVEANHDEVELVSRQPQELYEITSLIGELMPRLPADGIFAVDTLLERPTTISKELPTWQWRDDRGTWHPYSFTDSRILENAHLNGDDEYSLNTLGRTYTIDFHSMQQINEDTGTSRPVQRRYSPAQGNSSEAGQGNQNIVNGDARVASLQEEHGLAASFIRSLFSVLYEVYSSSAGPSVRCKCLKALLRMVYYASPELLKEVLKNQIVSSHIAGMMASTDLRIVVGALQMAEILITKLPEVFGVHFRREGVMHQIKQLADPEIPLGVSPPKSGNSSVASISTMTLSDSLPSTSQSSVNTTATANGNATITPAGTPTGVGVVYTSTPETGRVRSPSPSHARFSDVLKRKRGAKRSGGSSRSKAKHDDIAISPSLMQDLFTKATSLGNSTPGNSSRSRYSGSSSKTGSFLSSLNPVRWGRSMNSSHERSFSKDTLNNLGKSSSNSNLTAGNREKTRTWIREQASKFLDTYSGNEVSGPSHPALNVLSRLTIAIQKLPTVDCGKALEELREILMESDISPFEVNHSGLIKALLNYLAEVDGVIDRDQRIRIFLNVFAALPLERNTTEISELNSAWMGALVAKLSGCVSQLEQFPVKVHDLPASSGASRGGTSALKFFNTHQLKCNLQRHPECTNLKQWKGGTVKIDPLALVQAIERYLVVRGYGRIRDKDTADSDEPDSDDDIDDTLAAVVISQSGSRHRLQFYIGNHALPYNMTVYQAIRQYSNSGNDQSETDTDNETPLGNAGIWVQTHTIYYKPIREEQSVASKTSSGNSSSHSSRKGKGSGGKSGSRRKGDDLWNEGITPSLQSPISSFLKTKLPESVDIQDASLEVLCLLRILNAFNLYWNYLYPALQYKSILPLSDFLNSKIAAKACRQLQDPLVIMTGNLPSWLQQIASVCPFLFPFETRQLLFYVTSFDRDRALQRLLDMSPELTSVDSQERVTPRLERRKRTISRDDILKQAEQVIQDLGSSKALLEVQYEDEVGTGLGPTLEFYALVSKELQRCNLEIWHAPDSSTLEYVNQPNGLFPSPLGKGIKVGHMSKIKNKFRFLGKFMAKAVMDSRMLDLPFSLTFYRWLLGQEHSMTMADLRHISPEIHKNIRKMQEIVHKRDSILNSASFSGDEKNELIEKLDLDGCLIDDLSIDFILPGYNIELLKNGKTTNLTIHNLHQYTSLVTHWFLVEGVNRQMEALREGFESVFPIQNLKMFHPEELEAVFCGNPRDSLTGWDIKTLMECCKPDHGYNADSRAIKFLFEVLSSYNREEQRLFIQFLTGTPRLPVGGFKALSPPLTVVRTTLDANQNPDDFLPSVMTCVNYLKLPDYSSIQVLREKLHIAASEGQHSFHLS